MASPFSAPAFAKAAGTLRAAQQREMQALLRTTFVGRSAADIPTPSLVIHADAAEVNKATLESLVAQFRAERACSAAAGGAEGAGCHPLRIRPHAKLHKSRCIAERVLRPPTSSASASFSSGGEEGPLYAGVCVQKVSEAEALSGYLDGDAPSSSSTLGSPSYSVKDIFISNEVGTLGAARRVAALHRWMSEENSKAPADATAAPRRLSVCVDSVASVELIVAALRADAAEVASAVPPLDVFIEVNIGQNRGGARPTEEALWPIVDAIFSSSEGSCGGAGFVALAGLHAYHGGAQHIRCPSERARTMDAAMDLTRAAKAIIEGRATCCSGAPFALATVTGAGTGTFAVAEGGRASPYTELQPGSYYVMDRDYLANRALPASARPAGAAPSDGGGDCGLFGPAMYVKASVVSKTFADADASLSIGGPPRVILDSGHKSSAIDSGLPCLAPWQARRLASAGGVSGDGDAAEWTNSYLVECINGGDDHMGFAAGLVKFIRYGGHSDGALPAAIATAEAQHRVGMAIVNGLSLGEAAWLIPGHCDPTFNLHDYVFIVRGASVEGGVVEDIAMIDARGCQQ